MASLQEMQFVQGVSNQSLKQAQDSAAADRYKEAAKIASDKYLAGDIEGAVATMMQVDPELTQGLLGQLGGSLNPNVQGQVARATTPGQLESIVGESGEPEIGLVDRFTGKVTQTGAKLPAKPTDSKEARLAGQFQDSLVFRYQQAAENSATYKSAITVINELPQLKSLLDDAFKNGGQSLAMLGPRIAKGLAGEVGVLTEQDVSRYVRNPALAQWLLGGAEKKFEGRLTEQDYSNLLRLGTIMEKNATNKLQNAYKQAARKMSRNMGMPLEEAEMLVNPTLDEETKSIVARPFAEKLNDTKAPSPEEIDAKVKVISPDGRLGMIPRDQLEAAQAQGYKLAE